MSVREINPEETSRASAYKLWMKAPNPMVTIFKTFDVMPLINKSRMTGMKFNMLLDHCIGKALLPVSFQFHHTQMDGAHAGAFLRNLEEEISKL